MPYIDGFLAAVPNDRKQDFIDHSEQSWDMFKGLGAIAQWETWGDEVPDGELTSFPMAVKAKPDETVVFSWVVWPDKATRMAAWEKMTQDPEMTEAMGEMPMDGARIIYGGFEAVVVKGG